MDEVAVGVGVKLQGRSMINSLLPTAADVTTLVYITSEALHAAHTTYNKEDGIWALVNNGWEATM